MDTSIKDKVLSNANLWTFEDDCFLINWIREIASNVEEFSIKSTFSLQKLESNVNRVAIALDNATSCLTSLQYTQFVESRVHDEDETISSMLPVCKSIENVCEEISSNDNVKIFVQNNLKLLNKNCNRIDDFRDKISSESSIYKLRNVYNNRPLPQIFNTKTWKESSHVGLLDGINKLCVDKKTTLAATPLLKPTIDKNQESNSINKIPSSTYSDLSREPYTLLTKCSDSSYKILSKSDLQKDIETNQIANDNQESNSINKIPYSKYSDLPRPPYTLLTDSSDSTYRKSSKLDFQKSIETNQINEKLKHKVFSRSKESLESITDETDPKKNIFSKDDLQQPGRKNVNLFDDIDFTRILEQIDNKSKPDEIKPIFSASFEKKEQTKILEKVSQISSKEESLLEVKKKESRLLFLDDDNNDEFLNLFGKNELVNGDLFKGIQEIKKNHDFLTSTEIPIEKQRSLKIGFEKKKETNDHDNNHNEEKNNHDTNGFQNAFDKEEGIVSKATHELHKQPINGENQMKEKTTTIKDSVDFTKVSNIQQLSINYENKSEANVYQKLNLENCKGNTNANITHSSNNESTTYQYSNIFLDEPPDDDLLPTKKSDLLFSIKDKDFLEEEFYKFPLIADTSDKFLINDDANKQIDYQNLRLLSETPPLSNVINAYKTDNHFNENLNKNKPMSSYGSKLEKFSNSEYANKTDYKNLRLFAETPPPPDEFIHTNSEQYFEDDFLNNLRTDSSTTVPFYTEEQIITKNKQEFDISNELNKIFSKNNIGNAKQEKVNDYNNDQLISKIDLSTTLRSDIDSQCASKKINSSDILQQCSQGEDKNFTEKILKSVTKTRVRAPSKRKPSTRRGRLANYERDLIVEKKEVENSEIFEHLSFQSKEFENVDKEYTGIQTKEKTNIYNPNLNIQKPCIDPIFDEESSSDDDLFKKKKPISLQFKSRNKIFSEKTLDGIFDTDDFGDDFLQTHKKQINIPRSLDKSPYKKNASLFSGSDSDENCDLFNRTFVSVEPVQPSQKALETGVSPKTYIQENNPLADLLNS